MYILPTDSIFNIVTLVFLVLILLGFAFLLIAIHKFLSKWLGFLQTEKLAGVDSMKQEAYVESSKLVEDARKESTRLIEEANSKAREILAGAEDLSDESRASLENALKELSRRQEELMQKTAEDLSLSYTKALEKQKDIGLHNIAQATKKIEKGVLDEVSQFEDIVHKETVESEKLIEDRINKEYGKVKGEINTYKEERLAKVDASIFDILKDVTTEVLGRALSMEDHRDLVIKSLEEAKRKNLFGGE